MVVVAATTEDELPIARAHLGDLGLTDVEVVAPSDTRRLLLVPVADEAEGDRLVARLRAQGQPAVARPANGPRLHAWARHTCPIVVADRLTVSFAWSEHDRRDLPKVVELDAGGFGSGGHPSTRLVLEELVGRITGGERVLDVGCGSGVLGLCALCLGAASMVGVDVDAGALEATRRNARLNYLEDRVQALRVPLREVEGAFDVVVANIGRATLLDLAPDLVRAVGAAGWLAVSGFSPPQSQLVASRLRPLRVMQHRADGEWSSLVLGRRLA